jgi:Helix-turn-helix domain
MEEERISLSQRERDRLKVLHEVQQGHLKQVEAAQRLRLTDRHIRRLLARLRREGDGGLVHRLRGRFSNRKIPPALQRTLRQLRQACYTGFGRTLAAEHLCQQGFRASRETLAILGIVSSPRLRSILSRDFICGGSMISVSYAHRLLAIYSGCLTFIFLITVLCGFSEVKHMRSFDEITVHRINVVEPDGTIRMVLTNKDRAPGLYVKNKEFPHDTRQSAGLLLFDDEGTENGGLIYGLTKDQSGPQLGAMSISASTNTSRIRFSPSMQDRMAIKNTHR